MSSTNADATRRNQIQASSNHGKQSAAFVLAHTDLVLALPEPGETYRWVDLRKREDTPEFDNHTDHVRKLQINNVVKQVGDTRIDGTRYTLWQTNRDLYEYATAVHGHRNNLLPCTERGHSGGFNTIDPDAGVYECGVEWCEERYDRGTIEEVFG